MPYSIQQTEHISNDPSRMVAKSTTTGNHPSTPGREELKGYRTTLEGDEEALITNGGMLMCDREGKKGDA